MTKSEKFPLLRTSFSYLSKEKFKKEFQNFKEE